MFSLVVQCTNVCIRYVLQCFWACTCLNCLQDWRKHLTLDYKNAHTTFKINTVCRYFLVSTVEPPNKGRVGAWTVVQYLRLSFIASFESKSLILYYRSHWHSLLQTYDCDKWDSYTVQCLNCYTYMHLSKVVCVRADGWCEATLFINEPALAVASKQSHLSKKVRLGTSPLCKSFVAATRTQSHDGAQEHSNTHSCGTCGWEVIRYLGAVNILCIWKQQLVCRLLSIIR